MNRLNKDYVGAALLILLGIFVMIEGLSYQIGTLTRMGAGYIPFALGVLITVVGLILGITAERGNARRFQQKIEWRGCICILAGVFSFVLFCIYGGLIPATFASVFIAALGDRKNSLRSAFVLACVMVVFGYVVFHVGLNVQIPLFSWG